MKKQVIYILEEGSYQTGISYADLETQEYKKLENLMPWEYTNVVYIGDLVKIYNDDDIINEININNFSFGWNKKTKEMIKTFLEFKKSEETKKLEKDLKNNKRILKEQKKDIKKITEEKIKLYEDIIKHVNSNKLSKKDIFIIYLQNFYTERYKIVFENNLDGRVDTDILKETFWGGVKLKDDVDKNTIKYLNKTNFYHIAFNDGILEDDELYIAKTVIQEEKEKYEYVFKEYNKTKKQIVKKLIARCNEKIYHNRKKYLTPKIEYKRKLQENIKNIQKQLQELDKTKTDKIENYKVEIENLNSE